MRWRPLFCALCFVVALGVATPASACMYNYVGPGPSERQRRAQAERDRLDFLQRHGAAVEAALARGVDPAAELATMLVPNIRAIPLEESDCGPVRELDSAFDRFELEGYLGGTYLAGHAAALNFDVWGYAGELFGPACNEELRARFADRLRRRLDDGQRRAAYLFLGARWGGREPGLVRLTHFRDWHGRRPPVDWSTRFILEITRWSQDTDEGRALQRLMDDFWQESGPSLGDNARACPATTARWPEMQTRMIAAIEAQNPVVTEQIRRRAAARPSP